MLALTRKEGQKIRIGDDVEISVVRISPTSVRIGIEAPRDRKIIRSEIEASNERESSGDLS